MNSLSLSLSFASMASFLHAHIHDMHLQIMMIMSLPKKNNKQGERKLLNNVWGEVPPGEISEFDLFCFTICTYA